MHEIDAYAPDLVVLAGYMRILSPAFVAHYQGRMLNIHPSLLPKYPGLHTHRQALENGDEEHGTSVHFVTDELDGGPVVLQAKVPVFAEDTEDDIPPAYRRQEHDIYPLLSVGLSTAACARKETKPGLIMFLFHRRDMRQKSKLSRLWRPLEAFFISSGFPHG